MSRDSAALAEESMVDEVVMRIKEFNEWPSVAFFGSSKDLINSPILYNDLVQRMQLS